MKQIKEITDHGQDVMYFECDQCEQCEHTVCLDAYDVLESEGNLHCPVCGAGPDHLIIRSLNNEN